MGGWVLRRCCRLQGSGRYSIYIANYASGNVGPHALIEMDVAASDPARGVVVLVDVAAQAGVSKYTGTAGGPAEGPGRCGTRRTGDPAVAGRCSPSSAASLPHLVAAPRPLEGTGAWDALLPGALCPLSPRLNPPGLTASPGPAAGFGNVGIAGNQPACAPCCSATVGTAACPGGKLSLIRSVVTMAMAVIRLGSDTSGCQAQLAPDERGLEVRKEGPRGEGGDGRGGGAWGHGGQH